MRREVAAALSGLALAACRGGGGEPPASRRAVRCAPVRTATVRDVVELRGTVAPLPDRDALVAPQAAGRVLRIEVREGDAVAAGQVVARIDDASLADAARQAEAALEKTRAERQNAETTRARVEQVFERGIAPRQELDDATAREAAARAAEAESQAGLRQARRQLDRAAVRSPLAGVVLRVLRRPGELVDGTSATPVVEVGDTSSLDLVADVPVQDLVRIARGARAAIVFPALPDVAFAGEVSLVAPAVDRATGIGSLRIRLRPPPPAAPPVGTFGVAQVETGEAREALLVPAAAVRSPGGGDGEVVVCGADRAAHVRRVRVGPPRDGQVEVRGVSAGERVAVEPVLGLADGEPIEERP